MFSLCGCLYSLYCSGLNLQIFLSLTSVFLCLSYHRNQTLTSHLVFIYVSFLTCIYSASQDRWPLILRFVLLEILLNIILIVFGFVYLVLVYIITVLVSLLVILTIACSFLTIVTVWIISVLCPCTLNSTA